MSAVVSEPKDDANRPLAVPGALQRAGLVFQASFIPSLDVCWCLL